MAYPNLNINRDNVKNLTSGELLQDIYELQSMIAAIRNDTAPSKIADLSFLLSELVDCFAISRIYLPDSARDLIISASNNLASTWRTLQDDDGGDPLFLDDAAVYPADCMSVASKIVSFSRMYGFPSNATSIVDGKIHNLIDALDRI